MLHVTKVNYWCFTIYCRKLHKINERCERYLKSQSMMYSYFFMLTICKVDGLFPWFLFSNNALAKSDTSFPKEVHICVHMKVGLKIFGRITGITGVHRREFGRKASWLVMLCHPSAWKHSNSWNAGQRWLHTQSFTARISDKCITDEWTYFPSRTKKVVIYKIIRKIFTRIDISLIWTLFGKYEY